MTFSLLHIQRCFSQYCSLNRITWIYICISQTRGLKSQVWQILTLEITVYNRTGLAGAVLQTSSLFHRANHNLWKYFENNFTPRQKKLGCYNFERRFTSPYLWCVMCHMSCVMFHLSHVTWHNFFFWPCFEAIWWRVCYHRAPTPTRFSNKESHLLCIRCPLPLEIFCTIIVVTGRTRWGRPCW